MRARARASATRDARRRCEMRDARRRRTRARPSVCARAGTRARNAYLTSVNCMKTRNVRGFIFALAQMTCTLSQLEVAEQARREGSEVVAAQHRAT
eukprot:1508161-Pleurochrysis_carterae.AAC.1